MFVARIRTFLQMLLLLGGSKFPSWFKNLAEWIDDEIAVAFLGLLNFDRTYDGLRTWLRHLSAIQTRLALLTDTQLDDEAACLVRDLVDDDEQYGHVYEILSAFIGRVEDGQPVELCRADAVASAEAAAINPATILMLIELALEVIAVIKRLRDR